MFYSTLLIAATAFTGFVSAQNYSTSGPLTITISEVPEAQRESWCVGQRSNCPAICGGQSSLNDCDAPTLEWTCDCADGSSPNISDYINTVPYYICTQWKINCVAAHPDDITGQTGCLSVTCGQRNATATSAGGSASSSSAAPSSSASSGGSGGSSSSGGGSGGSSTDSASGSDSSEGAAVMNIAQNYGTSIVVAGLLAMFGLAL